MYETKALVARCTNGPRCASKLQLQQIALFLDFSGAALNRAGSWLPASCLETNAFRGACWSGTGLRPVCWAWSGLYASGLQFSASNCVHSRISSDHAQLGVFECLTSFPPHHIRIRSNVNHGSINPTSSVVEGTPNQIVIICYWNYTAK